MIRTLWMTGHSEINLSRLANRMICERMLELLKWAGLDKSKAVQNGDNLEQMKTSAAIGALIKIAGEAGQMGFSY